MARLSDHANESASPKFSPIRQPSPIKLYLWRPATSKRPARACWATKPRWKRLSSPFLLRVALSTYEKEKLVQMADLRGTVSYGARKTVRPKTKCTGLCILRTEFKDSGKSTISSESLVDREVARDTALDFILLGNLKT
ncbi:hypothetical protein CIHG_08044 [Coccidioides immitis H538.4]|uniref:Uncharacterized protein n=3 Tax=Coccidioides immitis TaxID=5501 RepID=A0A0J8TN14_COCIT|nr:hypothetical protein CIRG_09015 [Coccidioides immitis RMSCC 2394]KMU75072.1 hypothetical protein CISG_04359 [Coccidioides immitis RMSCC 3703]KMU90234.1 hypothetical protein CIHG_08044 [Coccidioides immitis H538.4]